MSDLLALMNEYRIIIGAIITSMVLVVVVKLWWEEVKFFFLNFWYKIPLIGKISRLSKDLHVDENKFAGATWFSSERQLCEDYFNHYTRVAKDAEHYEKCAAYLRKVDEIGRNDLHFLGWVLIAAMVFVEAMGFSYVLSGFTIPGASENVQQMGAVGIAFLVSVLLVGFTHFSGHELYKNSLIKKIKSKWNKSGTDDPLDADNTVSLDQNIDDTQPQWKQMLNRLPHNADVTPTLKLTALTAVLVVSVAVGATYVRGKVLDQEAAERHIGSGDAVTQVSDDPYAEVLPQELQGIQDDANEAAEEEALDAYMSGGWATFIILAFIFVFIQILGVVIGFKTGFSGKESSAARKDLGKFKTKREFVNYYSRKKQIVSRQAQKNLTNLQQRLAGRAANVGTEKQLVSHAKHTEGRSFLNYAETALNDERESDQRTIDAESAMERRVQEAVSSGENVVDIADKSGFNETQEEIEARILREEKEKLQQELAVKKSETEDEMRARLRRELLAEME